MIKLNDFKGGIVDVVRALDAFGVEWKECMTRTKSARVGGTDGHRCEFRPSALSRWIGSKVRILCENVALYVAHCRE